MYNAYYRTLDPSLGRWWQVDPAAEKFYGSTPYNSMGNSPIVFADPEGDEIITAIIVGAVWGAAISGGIAVAQGKPIAEGWKTGALTGAAGGAIGVFGGGSLINDMLWGTVQGGVTGGIGAELNGGDFWDGFKSGAITGGALTFAFNLPDAIQNARAGFGFNTDIGSFQNAARDAVSGGTVNPAKAQRALDFWTDRFGGPSLDYLPTYRSGMPQSSHVNPKAVPVSVNISGVGAVAICPQG